MNGNDMYSNIDFYELPHIYGTNFTQSVVLSTNMYEMPLIYDNNGHSPADQLMGPLIDTELMAALDPKLALHALSDLKSRQDLLLKRIQVLEDGLSSTPVAQNSTTTSSSTGTATETSGAPKDLVLWCNARQIPLSVLAVIKRLKSLGVKVLTKFYFHSTINGSTDCHSSYLNKCLSLVELNEEDNRVERRLDSQLIVSLIFKDMAGHQVIVKSNQSTTMSSEADVLKFVVKVAAQLRPQLSSLYEGIDDKIINEINDKLLMASDQPNAYYSQLESRLSQNKYLSSKSPSIADLLLFSGLNHRSNDTKLSPNLVKWFNSVKQFIVSKH